MATWKHSVVVETGRPIPWLPSRTRSPQRRGLEEVQRDSEEFSQGCFLNGNKSDDSQMPPQHQFQDRKCSSGGDPGGYPEHTCSQILAPEH
ncbi:unnamed protein product [Merluccius merluccius]